jgi:hypothetical protein
MPLSKKNTGSISSTKKLENKAIMITKSKVDGNTLFPKKTKAMNDLLAKSKLLS